MENEGTKLKSNSNDCEGIKLEPNLNNYKESKHELDFKVYYEETKHEPDLKDFEEMKLKRDEKDYEERYELNYRCTDFNKYSPEEPVKIFKHETEANDIYEDIKQDFKTIVKFKLKNENDTKTCYHSDETTKSTENIDVKAASKLFFYESTKNLVSKKKLIKPGKNEEYENNSNLSETHYTGVESGVSYTKHPLTEDSQNNNEQKIYSCAHCGYSTIKRKMFIEHLFTHSADRPFMCAHCSFRTKRKTSLRRHIVAMHLSNDCQNSHNNAANTNRARPFQCAYCDASYKYRYGLTKHIRQHHNGSGNSGKYKTLTCHICTFTSLNPFIMKTHSYTHSKKSFKCEKCDSFYSRIDVLKRHTLLHHTIGVYCKSCDRKFGDEIVLLRHRCPGKKKAKTLTPRFKCTVCAKAYVYKSVLDLHKLKHTTQQPFKCLHCARGFSTYTLLRYHIYSHSTESGYKCSTCNFTTDHERTMNTHEALHTKQNSCCSCTHCNYSTKKRNMFMKHREEHSSKGKFQCDKCNYSTDKRPHILKHLKLHH